MPTLDEAVPVAQAGPDAQGYRQLSRNEQVIFTRYTRVVLPLDGFVFWLNSGATIAPKVSAHVSVDVRQLEAETPSINRVIVTAANEIQPFNVIAPNTVWIGSIAGVRFAFSQRGRFYRQAGLFHYSGDAVYPVMASQLIDTMDQLNSDTLVVSNSLPAWLALVSYAPQWLVLPNPGITLYPSFAVPENLQPPYGAVHIEPSQTRALQAVPYLGITATQNQLAADRVRITLYGVRDSGAQAFLDLFCQYSIDTYAVGLMNMPIIRDEKQIQTELGILAMRKSIDFEVSYGQGQINAIARQLILHAKMTFLPQPYGE